MKNQNVTPYKLIMIRIIFPDGDTKHDYVFSSTNGKKEIEKMQLDNPFHIYEIVQGLSTIK